MRNRRLIFTGFIAIILISILFISNTYSIFTTNEADPNTNVYTTGNLDITYELSDKNIKFTDSKPINDNEANYLEPYRITVTNSGNVDYKFDVKLEDTTATNVINYNYIMVKVGKHNPISLNKTKNNIIKSGIIVKANSSIKIDVKVYISDRIPNSEIGKNFSARLSINGIAVIYNEGDVDNSDLVSNYEPLSNVKVGSYVSFDKCTIDNCKGDNANYKNDDDMGYCYNVGSKYKTNGYRVAYIKEGIVYLISAGSIECYNNTSVTDTNKLIDDLNKIALKYCDDKYIYNGKCNSNNIWSFNENDFKNITNLEISTCSDSNNIECGHGNDLINNGGYYWIISNDNLKQNYWNPLNTSIASTTRLNEGYGIRVVMKLKEGLYVDSGSGTYTNPFIISNK